MRILRYLHSVFGFRWKLQQYSKHWARIRWNELDQNPTPTLLIFLPMLPYIFFDQFISSVRNHFYCTTCYLTVELVLFLLFLNGWVVGLTNLYFDTTGFCNNICIGSKLHHFSMAEKWGHGITGAVLIPWHCTFNFRWLVWRRPWCTRLPASWRPALRRASESGTTSAGNFRPDIHCKKFLRFSRPQPGCH